MATDIIGRPRALRALVELRSIEPKAMTAGQFQRATGYTVRPAAELRADLEEWGLITVTEQAEGKVPVMQIRLTQGGQELADLVLQAESIAKRARKNRGG